MDTRRLTSLSVLALAAASWAQVTLPGGVTVPKERFIVYIVVGNSEAEGQTTVSSSSPNRPVWDQTHPRLWNFNVQDNNNPGPHHTWIPAQGKNHAGSLASYPNWLGPDMPLLKELIAQYSSEYYFGLLKIANQGDRLRGQYLLNQIGWADVAEWTQIVDAIAAIGPNTVTWGGVFTIFCDMETHDALMGYAGAVARLDSLSYDATTLTQRLRQQTNSDLPLLFACPAGDYATMVEAGRRDIWDKLNAQLALIPTLAPKAAVIPVWWLPDTNSVINTFYQHTGDGDAANHHYNDGGLLRLATETVNLIKANGWVPPLGTDTQAPTAPTNLIASNVGPVSLTLSWTASTDDVGISSYTVYRNGDSATSTSAVTVGITGLQPSTAYTFTVRARDFSGKTSPLSAPLTVTTAPPGADVEAPTAPTGLHAVAVGLTSAVIAWNASTDNVGVTGYFVYRDGVPIDTVTATQDTIDGLAQQTSYSFTVRARDAAGNVSVASNALAVTTGTPVAFPFLVDVGGPAAVGGYLADKAWDGQGYGYTGTTSVAIGSGDVRNTTDDSVYHTERVGADMGYRVALPPGVYDITLMFAEFWWPAGSRVFTPFVNGVAATTQPIDVSAAVGLGAAYTVTFRREITTGLMDLTFTHQGGNTSGEVPILNGLAIDNAPAYVIQSPVNQAVYHVGDTLHIQWVSNTYLVNGTDILVSADDGDEWKLVNTEGTVFARDPTWGDYPFVIPAGLDGVSLVGSPIMLKLSGYNSSYSTEMSGTFTVLPSSTAAPARTLRAERLRVGMADGQRVVVEGIPDGGTGVLEVHALNGALVQRHVLGGSGVVALQESRVGAGTCIAVVRAGDKRLVRRLVVR